MDKEDFREIVRAFIIMFLIIGFIIGMGYGLPKLFPDEQRRQKER